jgi:hypothetical protein
VARVAATAGADRIAAPGLQRRRDIGADSPVEALAR